MNILVYSELCLINISICCSFYTSKTNVCTIDVEIMAYPQNHMKSQDFLHIFGFVSLNQQILHAFY